MRLMLSSLRLPSGGKAGDKTVFEGTCSFLFVNRWFIGNQGIVGNSSSSSSSNRMGTVCMCRRDRQSEREADGCLTVKSTDGPLTMSSRWLSADRVDYTRLQNSHSVY